MAHQVSAKGIVGLGALGRAIDQLTSDRPTLGVVFFTVKAFDLRNALLEQADKWPIHLPFITMCNGYIWPIILDTQNQLGGRAIRVGMTTIGSTIMPSGDVRIFADGTTTAWGNWPSPGKRLIPAKPEELKCLESFPNGTWNDDIRPMVRRKWILNVAINSVAAVHGLERNGLLIKHKQEVEDVLAEAVELSEKLWNGLPQGEKEKEKLSEQLWLVVEKTANNQNSMVRDVLMGRRTESEFLAGMARDFFGYDKLKKIHEAITKTRIIPKHNVIF